MKKLIYSLLCLLLMGASDLMAQGDGMNYQAVVRNSNGSVKANQSVKLRFSILKTSPSGAVQYRENHTVTTDDFGHANLVVGKGTVETGVWNNINWGTDKHYFKVELEENSTYVTMGNQELQAVPYAMYALGSNSSSNWTNSGSNISNANSGNVGVGIASPAEKLHVSGGDLRVDNAMMGNGRNSDGTLKFLNNGWGRIGAIDGLSLWGNGQEGTDDSPGLYINPSHEIGIGTINPADLLDIRGGADAYSFEVRNTSGEDKVFMGRDGSDVGYINIKGDNGNRNILAGFLSGQPNSGYVGVSIASGGIEAGMYADGSQGYIFADVKNFRMDHPSDPSKEIWYACVEGPEAAAYVRGTGTLVNGRAVINFPDHFSEVINATDLTIVLTPGDLSSKGLAVYEKENGGFKVGELDSGTGNYSFDWEAKAVRKGYENYQPVREKKELFGDAVGN